MNKQDLLKSITDNVRKKHPWQISQEKYLKFFGELPKEFLEERIVYDNLVKKSEQFKICYINISNIKVDIKLTLDECIAWEIARWEEAGPHNILPGDIKKLLK
jgi:hypothetical protein